MAWQSMTLFLAMFSIDIAREGKCSDDYPHTYSDLKDEHLYLIYNNKAVLTFSAEWLKPLPLFRYINLLLPSQACVTTVMVHYDLLSRYTYIQLC